MVKWIGEGPKGLRQCFNRLVANSLKLLSLQKVSHTCALNRGGSQKVMIRLNSIGTRILEVCECPVSVEDKCDDFGEGLRKSKQGIA